MARKITPAMIRRYFGPRANIHEKFFGGFHVTTPTGGDIEITQTQFQINAGGDDIYEAMTLLSGEAWGSVTVSGPADHVVALLAHGEATGVDVVPTVKPGCGCGGLVAALIVFVIVLGASGSVMDRDDAPGAFLIAGVVAAWVWSRIKKSQKRDALRQAQALRYPYPRIHGGPRAASYEQAARQGWL